MSGEELMDEFSNSQSIKPENESFNSTDNSYIKFHC